MRKVGIGGLIERERRREQMAAFGAQRACDRIEDLKASMEAFRERLQEFSRKNHEDLMKDPALRYYFNTACVKAGIEPFATSQSAVGRETGLTDFYARVSTFVIEECARTRAADGGITPLNALASRVAARLVRQYNSLPPHIRKNKPPPVVSPADIQSAVEALSSLDRSYRIIRPPPSDPSTEVLVMSVPSDVSPDAAIVLSLVSTPLRTSGPASASAVVAAAAAAASSSTEDAGGGVGGDGGARTAASVATTAAIASTAAADVSSPTAFGTPAVTDSGDPSGGFSSGSHTAGGGAGSGGNVATPSPNASVRRLGGRRSFVVVYDGVPVVTAASLSAARGWPLQRCEAVLKGLAEMSVCWAGPTTDAAVEAAGGSEVEGASTSAGGGGGAAGGMTTFGSFVVDEDGRAAPPVSATTTQREDVGDERAADEVGWWFIGMLWSRADIEGAVSGA